MGFFEEKRAFSLLSVLRYLRYQTMTARCNAGELDDLDEMDTPEGALKLIDEQSRLTFADLAGLGFYNPKTKCLTVAGERALGLFGRR